MPLPGQVEEHAPRLHLLIILTYFAISFSSQLLLLIPQFAILRVPLRTGPFALSLLLVFFPPPGARVASFRNHPALPFAFLVVVILCLELLNQYTSSMTAALAQVGLVIAILAPVFWASRLRITSQGLALIVFCLWVFNATSAGVGVLQVLYPGHFQPATSAAVEEQFEKVGGNNLTMKLADGDTISRPYGLTDIPGGAATAGLLAFVFGLGLLVSSKRVLMCAAYLAGMGMGLFIMYLAQVRASIVMCGVTVVFFAIVMSVRGEFVRLTGSLVALTVVVLLSTLAAFYIGGQETENRLLTLVADDAGTVYQDNRGKFLEYTFEVALPTYPFGAGLGRYGMMSNYFNHTADSGSLWAEIQWTSWAYDGGWMLVVVYPIAILAGFWKIFSIARHKEYGPVGLWAAILTAYNMSVIAVLFSYAFFISQSGLEFWILNAACISAAQGYLDVQKKEIPLGFESVPAPWRPQAAALPSSNPGASSPAPRRKPLGHRPLPAIKPVFE
jgi:hypothetical protein